MAAGGGPGGRPEDRAVRYFQCAYETGAEKGSMIPGSPEAMAPNLRSNIHTHTHMHTYIYAYTHTYIFTHVLIHTHRTQEWTEKRSVICKFFGYKEQHSVTFFAKRDLQPHS